MSDPFDDILNSKKSIEELEKEFEDANKKGSFEEDKRFWYPEVDKVGNGYGIIRFLPPPPDGAGGREANRWVKIWQHGFKGPGGQWYIENSLTTIGKDDPVSEYNSQLWNTGIEANKKIASTQKRKLRFFSNILVVLDPTRPENNGKVFLFRYGKRIFDMLNDAAFPTVPGDEPLDAFDMVNGANFKLVVRKVDGYPNYQKSTFDKRCPVAETKEAMRAIWEQEYSLQELIDPKHFKSYDELKTKFYKVIGAPVQTSAGSDDTQPWEESTPPPATAAPAAPAKGAAPAPAETSSADDDLAFFEELANGD